MVSGGRKWATDSERTRDPEGLFFFCRKKRNSGFRVRLGGSLEILHIFKKKLFDFRQNRWISVSEKVVRLSCAKKWAVLALTLTCKDLPNLEQKDMNKFKYTFISFAIYTILLAAIFYNYFSPLCVHYVGWLCARFRWLQMPKRERRAATKISPI